MYLHKRFELPDHVGSLEVVRRIAQSVGRSLDLQTILDVGLDETMAAFAVETGGIYLRDEKRNIMTLSVHHNLTDAFVKEKAIVKPNEGCAGTVMITGELFAEYRKEKRRFICEDSERLMGIDCLAAAPITSKEQVVGVLELFAPFARKLTEEEAKILQAIGPILGSAIENAKIHRSVKDEVLFRENLSAILKKVLSTFGLQQSLDIICKEATKLFGVTGVYILIYDEKTDYLLPKSSYGDKSDLFMRLSLSLDDPRSISSIVVKTGKAIYENNVNEKTKRYLVLAKQFNSQSILVAPLKTDGKLGSIVLSDTVNPEKFDDTWMQKALLFADQVSSIIRNANLFDELQRAKDKTDILLEDSRLILQASEAITSSFDINEILQKLSILVTDIIGVSNAIITLYDKDKDAIHVATQTGEKLPKTDLYLRDIGPLADTFYNGKVFWIHDFEGLPENLINIFEEANIKSIVSVPIKYGDTVFGALFMYEPGAVYEFSNEEIETIKGIARHAAIALENSRAYRQQKSIAETLQRAFIPKGVPDIAGYEFGSIYRPATVTETYVGGDFYDFIKLPANKLGILIGDVSGKGVEATTITAMVKDTIQLIAPEEIEPDKTIIRTNEFVCTKLRPPQFVTAIFAVLDIKKSTIQYTMAGHPPPVLIKNLGEEADFLINSGPPLGVDSEYIYEQHKIKIKENDLLFMYTDGITEAKKDKELYGEKRLINNLIRNSRFGAKSLAGLIMHDVESYTNGVLSDDIAIIAIGKTGQTHKI